MTWECLGWQAFQWEGSMGLPRICPCFSLSGDRALRFAVSTDPLFTPGALQAPGEPLCLAIVWQLSVYLTWQLDVASATWKLAEWAQDHSWTQDFCGVHMWAGSTSPAAQLSHAAVTETHPVHSHAEGRPRPWSCWGQAESGFASYVRETPTEVITGAFPQPLFQNIKILWKVCWNKNQIIESGIH